MRKPSSAEGFSGTRLRQREFPCRRYPRLLNSGYPNPLRNNVVYADALRLNTTTRLERLFATRARCRTLQALPNAEVLDDREQIIEVDGRACIGTGHLPERSESDESALTVSAAARCLGNVFVVGEVCVSDGGALRGDDCATNPMRLDVAASDSPSPTSTAPRFYCQGATFEETTIFARGRFDCAHPEVGLLETVVADKGNLTMQSLQGPGTWLLRHALDDNTWSAWTEVLMQ